MATKVIGGQEPIKPKSKRLRANDATLKPLAKVYVDSHPEKDGQEYPIYSGKVTQKGFLLLDCGSFTVLFPAGIEIATTLLDDILPALNNKKGNQLVAILNRANRFGAVIGTSDESQIYYCFDAEEEVFFTSKEKPSKSNAETKKLTLEDFGTLT
jgi:hypothetical protein